MEEYKVIIFPSAQDDLTDIAEILNATSPGEAARYLDLLIETAEPLKTAPESRPLAKDVQFRLRGYRTLPVKNTIIFYSFSGKIVGLRRILFSRPQYEGMI